MVGMPAWHTFKNTFLLDRNNLREFIEHHYENGFDGKFVFCQGKLALHEGEEVRHRQLRNMIVPAPGCGGPTIAAFLALKGEGKTVFLELNGRSGQYREPTRADFARVAEFLATELVYLGLTSERLSGAVGSEPGMIINIYLDKIVE